LRRIPHETGDDMIVSIDAGQVDATDSAAACAKWSDRVKAEKFEVRDVRAGSLGVGKVCRLTTTLDEAVHQQVSLGGDPGLALACIYKEGGGVPDECEAIFASITR